ncbi:MAG: amidohydrolase [Bernardetiaceae bacterium]|jgi:predicted amidohydrolase|nr:amidohydrolase [Bernardetiaceae bacterium]
MLTVSLLQTDLHWEQPAANLAMLEEQIWQIGQPTDVILLPEMFTTGFSMNAPALAEPMNLHTFKWLKQQAQQTGAAVAGSYMVQVNGQYFNRLVWMQPDGQYFHYDKRHLFRLAGEHQTYTAGQAPLVVQWRGWRICPLICYDLRFPVWSRRTAALDYDLLVYLANWPQPRVHAWSVLLRARAVENQAYCVGVNRTGTDGTGKAYTGDSAIIDFKGEALWHQAGSPTVATRSLDLEALREFRRQFPFEQDADSFTLH